MKSDWFKDARFGVFVHWGPYSIHGRCVWARYRERMPAAEYEGYVDRFTAGNYRPSAWVDLCWEAGARYMVFCTRQHPGFSLFATEASEFNSVKRGPKRDLVADYVAACRSRGMKIGFYYSLLDWRYPAYFDGPQKDPKGWEELLEYNRTQVRELCSNYGKIDVLWYDGGWPWSAEQWQSRELNSMVRELQPEILINGRSRDEGDFETPEQALGSREQIAKPWESCITMNDHWAYNPNDTNWKSSQQLIHTLVQCISYGGNLLLDVGPKPDGPFPKEAVKRLKAIGRVMQNQSEGFYGNARSPFNKVPLPALKEDTILSKQGVTTWKDGTLYLHILHWPGREIVVGNLRNRVVSVRLVATGASVEYEQGPDRLILKNLPKRAPVRYDTVIALEIEGEPMPVEDFRLTP